MFLEIGMLAPNGVSAQSIPFGVMISGRACSMPSAAVQLPASRAVATSAGQVRCGSHRRAVGRLRFSSSRARFAPGIRAR